MFDRVLFVCTGNICRSPMAEGMLRALVGSRVEVGSAGTAALLGHPADDQAREVLAERGIDIAAHRARFATPELLRGSDLVLAMQRHHLAELFEIDPTARGKSFLVGHWLDQREIDDPYQQGRDAFERTMAELEAALAEWLRKL